MLNKATLQKIQKLAREIDWNQSFKGKSKGNRHLARTVKIAKFLAARLNVDQKTVEAGAWLHDTALPSGNDYDYKRNKRIANKLLRRINLTPAEREAIAECVASHEGTVIPKTLEAKIVHDADVLEKSGMLGLIRHTWKMTNSGLIKNGKIGDKAVKELLRHLEWRSRRLQTSVAKKIARHLNSGLVKKDIKPLVTEISNLARQGIITEKIAKIIGKKLRPGQNKKLREQLSLTYLKSFN